MFLIYLFLYNEGRILQEMELNIMASYSRKEIYNLTSRLYALLRDHEDRTIIFKKLHGNLYAYYEPGTEEIVIDHRREIIPCLIHEVLHKWHPSWSETSVLEHERAIVNSLSSRQVRHILIILGQNL